MASSKRVDIPGRKICFMKNGYGPKIQEFLDVGLPGLSAKKIPEAVYASGKYMPVYRPDFV